MQRQYRLENGINDVSSVHQNAVFPIVRNSDTTWNYIQRRWIERVFGECDEVCGSFSTRLIVSSVIQVKHSSMSFFSYLKEIDEEAVRQICDKVLDIFDESHKNERMITSLLTFMVRLISSGCIQFILDDPESTFPRRLLTLLKREIKSINNMKLLISSVGVFCQLLQVRSPVSKEAFSQLSIFLCNKFMCMRKITAIRTYEALTLYGEDMDLPEDDLASVLNELNSTDWEQSVTVLRPIRNHLCELMKVSPPVKITKP